MDLRDLADRVRHDLGKYVTFSTRFLPDDAPLAERREALRDDLLRTRRGPAGEATAAEVWAGLRGELAEVPAELRATVVSIDALVAEIDAQAREVDTLDATGLAALADRARALATLTRTLASEARVLSEAG